MVMIWPDCYGYTSDRPVISGTLTDIFTSSEPGNSGNDNIDSTRIRLWIDGKLWAASTPTDDDDEYFEPWARGNGSFSFVQLDPDDDIRDFRYIHSTLPQDALTPGVHTYEIQFATQESGDAQRWFTWRASFAVDGTAPFVRMDGGAVSSPVLRNVAGYIDATEPALTARLWDFESGVFARPNHQDPIMNILWGNFIGGPIQVVIPPFINFDQLGLPDLVDTIRVIVGGVDVPIDQDMGLKMDVWLVDGEDDEDDIDEYLDRTLIQAGTPDMLRFTPPLQPTAEANDSLYYDPSDTLTVRFPITANLAAYDGREIEVVLYSAKVEHIGHDIQTPGLFGDDDEEGEEFTKYLLGAFDCVGNTGSAYVAARYIIDASAPKVAIVSPVCNGNVAPGSGANVVIALTDQGNRPDVDNDGDGRFGEDPVDGLDNDGDWIGRVTIDGVVQYVDDRNRNGQPDPGEPHVDEDPNDAATFAGVGIDTSSIEVTVIGPDGDDAGNEPDEFELHDGCDEFSIVNGIIKCDDGDDLTLEGPLPIGTYTISVSATTASEMRSRRAARSRCRTTSWACSRRRRSRTRSTTKARTCGSGGLSRAMRSSRWRSSTSPATSWRA
jgi:hypothetical protein